MQQLAAAKYYFNRLIENQRYFVTYKKLNLNEKENGVKKLKILNKIIPINELSCLEEKTFFSDMSMMKAVIDIDREILAVNAELHSDLEQMLLEDGSNQKYLYGINIYYDNGEIEFDSLINPPRNREAGYPRVGRGVADPKAREKIVEVVNKWIKQ